MKHTAKLFMNGRSQAVRLPAKYRFDCNEVYIRKDPETDDIIISKKPGGTWDELFELLDSASIPNDFMDDRDNAIEDDKDLF
jgi:antitoxin VapB